MSALSDRLLPPEQRLPLPALLDQLDLDDGAIVAKRSGFWIMLVLSAVIATAGVEADSVATVIGAMIIAPLATPILGVAAAIVAGRARMLGGALLWLVAGAVAVVVIGAGLSFAVPNPGDLAANSQIASRTSPQLLDLLAALATGTAGAFAMCRRDLGNVLPGVAISISLVPPLAVVGVTAGRGDWDLAGGALVLFLSNVIALIIAGSIVFTVAGYSREAVEAGISRARAYRIVGVIALLVAIPLAAQTAFSIVITTWTASIEAAAEQWLISTPGARIDGVQWSSGGALVEVRTPDGLAPDPAGLDAAIGTSVPDWIEVSVDVSVGSVVTVR